MGSDLFDYPTGGGVAVPESPLLAEASPADWDVVRRHRELRRYRTGERVSGAHDTDRVPWMVVDTARGAEPIGGKRDPGFGDACVGGDAPYLSWREWYLAGVRGPS